MSTTWAMGCVACSTGNTAVMMGEGTPLVSLWRAMTLVRDATRMAAWRSLMYVPGSSEKMLAKVRRRD